MDLLGKEPGWVSQAFCQLMALSMTAFIHSGVSRRGKTFSLEQLEFTGILRHAEKEQVLLQHFESC